MKKHKKTKHEKAIVLEILQEGGGRPDCTPENAISEDWLAGILEIASDIASGCRLTDLLEEQARRKIIKKNLQRMRIFCAAWEKAGKL